MGEEEGGKRDGEAGRRKRGGEEGRIRGGEVQCHMLHATGMRMSLSASSLVFLALSVNPNLISRQTGFMPSSAVHATLCSP